MELTEADLPGEHAVAVGEDLVVRLAENRTTGYRWHLELPKEGVELADDSYEPPDPGRPGAGGVRTFRLHATTPGSHRLGATLRRPWGSGDDATPGLEFQVTAR